MLHFPDGADTARPAPTYRMNRTKRVVNAIITGLHEPISTHLAMLECVVYAAGGDERHLGRAYAEARDIGYLWHEFGDSHLIIGAHALRLR